jgi:hypothetical protein
MNTEEIVDAYLNIREARQKLAQEFEDADNDLKKDMTHLEQMLLATCQEIGADSIKTKFGTVIRRVNERFYCTDWENFRKFVLENDAVDLFERRLHQGNFRQFLEEHESDGLPPGVNVMREYGVTVRKSNTK